MCLDNDRKASGGEISTSGTLGSGYTWLAYWYGGDSNGIEVDLGDSGGWSGCPHSNFDIRPDELEAMVAGLAAARIEWETTNA